MQKCIWLAGRFQQVNLGDKQPQQAEQNFISTYKNNSKSKVAVLNGSRCPQQKESEDQYEEYSEELLDGEKTSYTSSTTTPHSRCSRGVSTEELDEVVLITNPLNSNTTLADKLKQREDRRVNYPKRLVEGPVSLTSAAPSRYSVLLQLIACGSSGSEFKEKQQETRLSNVGTSKRRESNVHEDDSICVSENPRLLGNLQSEEKEYFSGSIVESMKANRQTDPVLKKSNSYNEER